MRSRGLGSAVSNGEGAETSLEDGVQKARELWRCCGRAAGKGGTHRLAEGLGLGGPHVQMGHHGLQPLTLLGKLWTGREAGGEQALCLEADTFFSSVPHQTPQETPIPTTTRLQASASRFPLSPAPLAPHTLKALDRGCLLHEAFLASLPDCVSQAPAHQQSEALFLIAHSFSP